VGPASLVDPTAADPKVAVPDLTVVRFLASVVSVEVASGVGVVERPMQDPELVGASKKTCTCYDPFFLHSSVAHSPFV
jgi:hypothetical protein